MDRPVCSSAALPSEDQRGGCFVFRVSDSGSAASSSGGPVRNIHMACVTLWASRQSVRVAAKAPSTQECYSHGVSGALAVPKMTDAAGDCKEAIQLGFTWTGVHLS